MSKFCTRCGNILADDALFCTKCGSAQQPPIQPMNQPPMNQQPPMAPNGYAPMQQPMNQPPMNAGPSFGDKVNGFFGKVKNYIRNNPKVKKYGIIGGSVLAGIIVLIIVLTIAFPSPKAVVNKYCKAFGKGDAKTVVSCMCDAMFTDEMDEDDYIEMFEDNFDEMEFEDFEYEIKGIKDLSKSEIKALEETFEYIEEYYDNDFDADKVSGYKKVKVKISYDSEYGDYSGTQEFILIKYMGQWKIFEI